MTELDFIMALHDILAGLPHDELEERLCFYSEMIKDRVEEGLSEEEAVAAIGSVEEIAEQILADIPLAKIAKERIKPKRRLHAWEIVLLAVGSPIWLSLAISAAAVIFSLYVSAWAVIVSFWAVFISVAASALGGAAAGIGFMITGDGLSGAALLGAALVCGGLSVFTFFGCKAATVGLMRLTKKMLLWIKSCFLRKEYRK